MKVIDEGDRISHPIEYSAYHEDEPEVSLIYQFQEKPKKIEYSSYMEEGEQCPIKHAPTKQD